MNICMYPMQFISRQGVQGILSIGKHDFRWYYAVIVLNVLGLILLKIGFLFFQKYKNIDFD